MGGSVAYVGVWPGSFKTVPMTGGGPDPFATSPVAISPAACSDCQPRSGCASVRTRSTMHRWCSSNASDVKMYGDIADPLDEYFRSRLPRGRCTGETGRETTEGAATAVISTPSDNVENRPGTPRCAGLVLGTRIGMYTPHLFKGPLSSILFDGRVEVNHAGGSAVTDRADGRAIRTEGRGAMLTNVLNPSRVGIHRVTAHPMKVPAIDQDLRRS